VFCLKIVVLNISKVTAKVLILINLYDMATWKNWAENVVCNPVAIYAPKSELELKQIILNAKAAGKRVRVMGSGHSFTALGDTNEFMITLQNLKGVINIDKINKQATVWAGTSINEAGKLFFEQGLGQINLGDIDVQSLAGATSTGTHGTGKELGGISTQIVAFALMTANGEVLECSPTQNAHIYEAGRVALGSFGVLIRLTLQLTDAYKLQYVTDKTTIDKALATLDKDLVANRNVEYYWFPYTDTLQSKLSNISTAPVQDSPIKKYINQQIIENNALALLCGIGKNVPSSYQRVNKFMAWAIGQETRINYSHLIYASVRKVKFKEMEYNIPAEHFPEVLKRVKEKMDKEQYKVFFPVECRWTKADDIWLSPSYGRDSAYLAFHVYKGTEHDPYFKDMEAICMEYDGRPHWGKMHTRTAASLAKTYPRWNDFLALRAELDPEGLFLNDYLNRLFGLGK
jgi:FAD-linked oxidoreductase